MHIPATFTRSRPIPIPTRVERKCKSTEVNKSTKQPPLAKKTDEHSQLRLPMPHSAAVDHGIEDMQFGIFALEFF